MMSSANQQTQLYLAIRLTDQTAQAVLWQIVSGKIEILEISALHVYEKESDCIEQVDEALQELGPQSEGVDQVLFGLEPKWVSDSADVVEAKKPLLHKLTKDLSLKPIGFVSVPEAISQNFAQDEPLFSALMLEVDNSNLRISLVQRGQLASYQEVGRSDDIVADTREALARIEQDIGQDHLPPRIIIFSNVKTISTQLRDLQQKLINFDWVASHPFLSAPVIDFQVDNLSLKAIVEQGGLSIAKKSGVILTQPDSVNIDDDFGFEDLDFAKKDQLAPEDDNLTAVDDELRDALGVATPVVSTLPELEQTAVSLQKPKKKKNHPLLFFKKLFSQKSNQAEKSNLSHKPFILAGFIGGLIILVLIGLATTWFSTKAEIKIKLKTQTISQDTILVLDPKATQSDPEKKILPAKLELKSVSSSKTVETTGVKLIGDKAQGMVTIYNKTNGEKTFEKGTVLSSGNLTFVLDSEVKVASASSSTESTIHGKAEAKIIAQKIGAESNLQKDTELQVESFSSGSYIAKVNEGLSGGSSREVRVVLDEDLVMAKTELVKQLLQIAAQEFKDQENGGTYYIPTGNYTTDESKYDAKEGDEVGTLTLDLSLSVEAASYNSSDLKPLAQALLQSQVPDGYQIAGGDPQILSSPAKKQDDSSQVSLEAQVSTQVESVIDLEQLKSEIAGKSVDAAQEMLRGKNQILSFEIILTPQLSAKIFKVLPSKTVNITITRL